MPRTLVIAIAVALAVLPAAAQDKPNIVLVFMDNFGWGEPGFNGGSSVAPRRRGWTRWPLRGCA
jgi:arylsulfatase